MEDLLNKAPCGFLSISDDGVILDANATLHDLLEYPPGLLRGMNIEAILPVPSRFFYYIHLFPLLEIQGRADEIYLSLRRYQGGDQPMLINAVRVLGEGAAVSHCVLMPIQRRLQYEDEIMRAKKAADRAAQERNQAITALEATQAELHARQHELLEINARLETIASTDFLTGIKNRRVFFEDLGRLTLLAERASMPLSVLMLDVDHFKRVNDTLGHLAGDFCLQQIAQLLQHEARETDVIARYGGEEFALILPNTDRAGALVIAERLRAAIAAHVWQSVALTVSIGAATAHAGGGPKVDLVVEADRALYASKDRGRNCVTHAALLHPGNG